MSYLIKVGADKTVKRVIVGDEEFLSKIVDDEAGEWVISPENYGAGYNYENGVFYPPRPYPSWKLDSNFTWQPPTPQPIGTDVWNEDKLTWQTRADYEKYQMYKPYIETVQDVLDSKAKQVGYDSILSACSYAGYPNPFELESQKFITWRGDVWTSCYTTLAQVESGTITMPTIDELIAGLPQYA